MIIIAFPLIIWAVGQTYKFLSNAAQRGRFKIADFAESGGMPSVHSAVVASLSTVTGIKEGVSSAIFGATLIFSLIIVHDAFRLRSVVEAHSKILNKLRLGLSPADQQLNPGVIEHVGHKLPEVIAGLIFGILGTMILIGIWG